MHLFVLFLMFHRLPWSLQHLSSSCAHLTFTMAYSRGQKKNSLYARNDWVQQTKLAWWKYLQQNSSAFVPPRNLSQRNNMVERHQCTSTCSSSCRSRWSWDSSCLLWSSNICILASKRPLCCLRSLASAMSSASSEACWGDTTESGGDARGFIPLRRCCSFSCSYSICRLLVYWKEEENDDFIKQIKIKRLP